MRNLLATAALLFSFAALAGCDLPGLSNRGDAHEAGWSGKQLAAATAPVVARKGFEETLYPLTRRNCAGCHGASQSPLFAVDDVGRAYDVSKTLVNFEDLSSSAFLRKVKDGHCGSNCNTDGSEMLAALEAWAADEGLSGSGLGQPDDGRVTVTLAPQPVPSPLPTFNFNSNTEATNSFTKMTWQLGSSAQPADPDLAGAVFELEIQRFTQPSASGPGSYRVRRPRAGSPSVPLRVQAVRVLVNGIFDPANNDYLDVDTTVAPAPIPTSTSTPLPFPVLSSDDMILIQDRAQGDQISVSFEVLAKGSEADCRALEKWVSDTKPVFDSRCTSCHSGGNTTATRRFSMSGTDAEVCSRSLSRADLANPIGSVLITNPRNRANGHPSVPGLTDAEVDAIVGWIDAEAAARP